MAVFEKASCHASDKRCRAVLLLFLDLGVSRVYPVNREALRLNSYDSVISRFYSSDNIERNSCRKHTAEIVVGVVAAYLGAPGCREKVCRLLSKELFKLSGSLLISLTLESQLVLSVDLIKCICFHKNSPSVTIYHCTL